MSEWLLLLGLWCGAAFVLVLVYAAVNWYARRRRMLRTIAERLRAIVHDMPMPYPGCWMCEGAAGLGVQAMVKHQVQVHGQTLPPDRRRAVR